MKFWYITKYKTTSRRGDGVAASPSASASVSFGGQLASEMSVSLLLSKHFFLSDVLYLYVSRGASFV
jgi:hypothetical protein